MSQTICRMYESHARAADAADALRNRGPHIYFANVFVNSIHTTPNSKFGAQPSADDIVAALTGAYVLKSHAKVYAERIQRGGALVTVHAPLGCAQAAIDILSEFGPIDSGLSEVRAEPRGYDEATPLSSIFNWRVLLDDSATFAKFWNLPPLSKSGATTSAKLGFPEISRSRGPYSPTLPLPLISAKAAPLSSMLGLPLLKASRSR